MYTSVYICICIILNAMPLTEYVIMIPLYLSAVNCHEFLGKIAELFPAVFSGDFNFIVVPFLDWLLPQYPVI